MSAAPGTSPDLADVGKGLSQPVAAALARDPCATDEALLRAVREKNCAVSLNTLVQRYTPIVRQAAHCCQLSDSGAEELAYECVVRLALKRTLWARGGSYGGFVRRLAYGHAVSLLREATRRKERERTASRDDVVWEDPTRLESCLLLHRAVEELGEPDRTIVASHYFLGQSDSEIAGEMGWNAERVKSRRQRALGTLLGKLGDEFPSLLPALPPVAPFSAEATGRIVSHVQAALVTASASTGGVGAAQGLRVTGSPRYRLR